MQQSKQESDQQIQVKASDEAVKGAYANMAMVGHSPTGEEFILDFMTVFPPSGALVSRIFMSPGHFKRLVGAMQDQVKKYEERFGAITPAEVTEQKYGFRTE